MPRTPSTDPSSTASDTASGTPSGPELAVQQLSEMIAHCVYRPGDRLPSESALIADYGISRHQARQVFRTLVQAGLANTVTGAGTFVRAPDRRRPHTYHRGISHQLDSTREVELLDTETGFGGWETLTGPILYRWEADPETALTMVLPERTALFAIDRELSATTDPEPAPGPGRRASTPTSPVRVTHRTYIPIAVCVEVPALGDALIEDPTDTTGLYSLLAEAGYELHWTETVRVIPATPDDVTSLGATLGGPILTTTRLTTTPDGRTLALEETYRDATTTQLTYTIRPDVDAWKADRS